MHPVEDIFDMKEARMLWVCRFVRWGSAFVSLIGARDDMNV